MTHTTRKTGADLCVGDTIQVWWKPRRDTITKLQQYTGPLTHLLADDGGAQIAEFAINASGMTIGGNETYDVIDITRRGTLNT